MGIYIDGMKMPTDGCHHLICIYSDGTVATGGREYKAIPVPPHGVLIERDKLREKEFIHAGDAYAVVMSRDIRNAPTIIPADTILENEIHIIDTKGKSNYDPKRRFVISSSTIIPASEKED